MAAMENRKPIFYVKRTCLRPLFHSLDTTPQPNVKVVFTEAVPFDIKHDPQEVNSGLKTCHAYRSASFEQLSMQKNIFFSTHHIKKLFFPPFDTEVRA